MHRSLLVALLAVTVLALAAAPAPYAGLSSAARVHLALAAGLAPLMLAAMLWFIPVLTRTAGAPRLMLLAPAGALSGGLALAVAFAGGALPPALAAVPAIAAALAVLGWSEVRARSCLGRPHPGLRWYQAALGLWLAGLLLVPAMAQWPAGVSALRQAHLHLNLLGFVGLTVSGTLAVLLPTVCGRADPGVVARLRRDLPVGIVATVLVALAAAGSAVPAASGYVAYLALAGAAGWLWLWARQLAALRRLLDGAPAAARSGLLPLAAALAGWGVLLVHGGAHALGGLAARPALAALLGGVLPALLSGAGAQLLPLWWWPGAAAARIAAARLALARGHGRRVALYGAAGVAALSGASGTVVAAAALAGIADLAVAAYRTRRRAAAGQLSR